MNNFLKNMWRNYRASIAFGVLLFGVFVLFLNQHLHIIFVLLNIAFIFSAIGLTSKIKNRIVSKTLLFLVSFVLSIHISFAILFSSPLTLGNMASFFETNVSEVISLPLSFLSIFLGCLLLATILIFRMRKEQKRGVRWQSLLYLFVGLIFFVNTTTILFLVRQDSNFFSYYRKELREVPLQTIYAYSSLRLPLLYGDIFGIAVYSLEKLESWNFKNFEKELPQGVHLEKENISVPKIYLVIGESAYRKRMSLYGYKIETTPFLDSIAKTDSANIHFYDGYAIANITRDAVRFSLSFASPFDKKVFWTEKNVVELAKDAGYHSVWLSNQGQAGLYDNYPSYIAKSSDEVYFENKLKKDDLDLLLLIDKYHEKGKNQLMTFHLMGSHFPFNERYDEIDNSYFEHLYTKKEDCNSRFNHLYSEKEDCNTINEYSYSESDYDKSVHHTDRFLQKLHKFTTSRNESSIIVYFSDHGANPNRGVHGLLNFEQSEYEIPFVIITNNVELDVDAVVTQYLSKGKMNNLNLPYILAQLMGYEVSKERAEQARTEGEHIVLVNGLISLIDALE